MRTRMTVTDPDVPDPLNDPRTSQADPGAYGQGADLASTAADPTATGEEELAAGRTEADDAGAATSPVGRSRRRHRPDLGGGDGSVTERFVSRLQRGAL